MKTLIKLTTLSTFMLVLACKPNYQSELTYTSDQAKPVRVVEMSQKTEPLPLVTSGIIATKAQAILSFKVGGIVEQISFDEGQTVRKGQILAILDLEEIDAQVNKAREALAKAERDLKRAENLLADSAATLEQLQNAQTAFEVAQSDFKIATFNRRYAEIKAPSNGKILKRFVEEGELVEPGNPVFMIGETGKNAYVVRIGVSDRDVVRIADGDKANYTLAAYPNSSFTARVSEIAEAADPMTGTFEIELTLDETNVIIKNGFIAKLTLFPSRIEPYYEIPMNALIEADRERTSIFVMNEEKAIELIYVKPIEIKSESFIISSSDLEPQSKVVTDGAAYLKVGDQVTILEDR